MTFVRLRVMVDGLLNFHDGAPRWCTLEDLPNVSTPSSTACSPRSSLAAIAGECEEWRQAGTGGPCRACLLRLPEAERLAPPALGLQYPMAGNNFEKVD